MATDEHEIWVDEAVATDETRGFLASKESFPVLVKPAAYVPLVWRLLSSVYAS